jgi:hypothetical protein
MALHVQAWPFDPYKALKRVLQLSKRSVQRTTISAVLLVSFEAQEGNQIRELNCHMFCCIGDQHPRFSFERTLHQLDVMPPEAKH